MITLLGLEALVSSLIVTAILKGSNTGFKKTDKLMKRIAVYVPSLVAEQFLISSVAIQAQAVPIIG